MTTEPAYPWQLIKILSVKILPIHLLRLVDGDTAVTTLLANLLRPSAVSSQALLLHLTVQVIGLLLHLHPGQRHFLIQKRQIPNHINCLAPPLPHLVLYPGRSLIEAKQINRVNRGHIYFVIVSMQTTNPQIITNNV